MSNIELGVHIDMPSNKYHAARDFYSSSDLKFIAKSSPYHFKTMRDTGIGAVKQSEDMIFGSMVHCLLLTPGLFDSEFYVCPTVDRRTKAGKEIYDGAMSMAGVRTVVNSELYDRARDCVERVQQNKQAMELLISCTNESSYFWKCAYSGLDFRARVDAVSADYMIEVKTSRSASPSAFERQAYNMFYDISAAHYLEGINAVSGTRPSRVYFIVIENEFPYVSQVYLATDSFLEMGHARWLETVNKLSDARSSDKWPGYGEWVLELSCPKWNRKEFENEKEKQIYNYFY